MQIWGISNPVAFGGWIVVTVQCDMPSSKQAKVQGHGREYGISVRLG